MTVLVDTSVWIRGLAGRPAYAERLRNLLLEKQVVGHELVYGELFIGDLGGRGRTLLEYELMRYAPMLTHREVVTFARARHLNGRRVGWIDVHLLASAVVGRHRVWTADPRFAALAAEAGVEYRSSP
jgi:predicted nucleic acid-binding protein